MAANVVALPAIGPIALPVRAASRAAAVHRDVLVEDGEGNTLAPMSQVPPTGG